MNKQRIKTNTIKTAASVTYYGGTLGAGVAFYELMNQPSALGIVTVLVVTLTVEGILRTLIDEILDALTPSQPTTAASTLAKTEGSAR
ncbi:hypothetical protein [Streptomyces leeuwenhoekii]|uniref:Sle1_109 protein n=1 Tax=Streptomyces leeuwenhoekii TaxID=1437453 RepID=A0A0F7VR45_STRLW|nr:hypothetical protein [Streptomyces leeuwenhoekii]CQR59276.1 sle1_109 [Streptomyces leeuwenhoekii]